MKKRTIIVVALAIVLALSFATIATAKYAGYAYNFNLPGGEINSTPGYLSWAGAQSITATDSVTQSLAGRAHGGYISTTVKCAVCHSVHRANSADASAGTVDATPGGVDNKLLAMGDSCVACHTAWGSGNATKKVEWGNADQGQAVGPHSSFNCTGKCHGGGIHGGAGSVNNGMNVYMLGGAKDAALATSFANGNTMSTNPQTWFVSGTTSPTYSGGYPAGVNSSEFAFAKATATGYTCAQEGCHTASQFAVNTWGFSENHGLDPAITTGATQIGALTGHRSAPGANNHTGATCGPCHPGNPAGGYRDLNPNDTPNATANAYGCDQCHDMVGKATNTTAWPHGNRGIDVYEWDNTGAQTVITGQPSGNLWMYSYDIALATGTTGSAAKDPSFKVINNAAGFQGTTPAGKPGNINDGVCLKCHVAIDSQSLTVGGTSPWPATTRQHSSGIASATTLPTSATSSYFIYLYR